MFCKAVQELSTTPLFLASGGEGLSYKKAAFSNVGLAPFRSEYQLRSSVTHVLQSGTGTFDYTVVFGQRRGGLVVQESRVLERGTRAFPFSIQDVGLPEMVLIFLPQFQGD